MTDLAQELINIQSKLVDLELDNSKLKETVAEQKALIHRLEGENVMLFETRDEAIRQNGELKALLGSAGGLIIKGIETYEANEAKLQAVSRGASSGNGNGARHAGK